MDGERLRAAAERSRCRHPCRVGPRGTARFGLPMVQAEASHAGKRSAGPWAPWPALDAAAIRAAARHLCFTPRDATGLALIVARQDRLGILTHHLAHDAAAWTALQAMLERLARHPAVRFTDAATLLGEAGAASTSRRTTSAGLI